MSVPSGNLFRASQDTVRDVYSNPDRRPSLSTLKRQRRPGDSLTDEEDAADQVMELDTVQEDLSQTSSTLTTAPLAQAGRPMRPLRRGARKLGATQSSPAILLGDSAGNQPPTATDQMVEEDDWSVSNPSTSTIQEFSYEPMALENM